MDRLNALRENGKLLYYCSNGDKAKIKEGIALLNEAARQGDAESLYIIGSELLQGKLRPQSGNRTESAYDYLLSAADHGSAAARGILNGMCMRRYGDRIHFAQGEPKPLTDFEGKKIIIDRKGVFVPVDAHLSFNGEMNTFTLSANIHFVFLELLDSDIEMYIESILQGFYDWEGEYEVFGGQKVRLVLKLTIENRTGDSVHVMPITEETRQFTFGLLDKMGKGKKHRELEETLTHRRSFAGIGFRKWSANSFKLISIQSRDGKFNDPNELRNIARHEFGHILGLGDLYASEVDGLEGVAPDRYDDLSCFHLFGKTYHLIMCDPGAPVSNNDIEMVLLAFSQNRYQRFQSDSSGKEVSEALGKGN